MYTQVYTPKEVINKIIDSLSIIYKLSNNLDIFIETNDEVVKENFLA